MLQSLYQICERITLKKENKWSYLLRSFTQFSDDPLTVQELSKISFEFHIRKPKKNILNFFYPRTELFNKRKRTKNRGSTILQ